MKMPDMGKMVGPLPLGAWIAIVGIGVSVVVFTRRSDSSQMVEDSTIYNDTSPMPGVGVGGSGMWQDLTVPTTSDNSTASATPTDNDEWAKFGLNQAIGLGYNPTQSDYAIRQYLSGGVLDTQSTSIINSILRSLGAPPSSLGMPESKPVDTEQTGQSQSVIDKLESEIAKLANSLKVAEAANASNAAAIAKQLADAKAKEKAAKEKAAKEKAAKEKAAKEKAAKEKASTAQTLKIAKEVIAGKWGSGTARQEKLKKAGYDWKKIQNKVNELLGIKKRY